MKTFVVAMILLSVVLLVACAAFTRPEPAPPPGAPAGTPAVQQPATAEQVAQAVAKALEPTPLGPWANIVSLAITAAVSSYATHRVKDTLAAARQTTGSPGA